jgi:hypothetical protein
MITKKLSALLLLGSLLVVSDFFAGVEDAVEQTTTKATSRRSRNGKLRNAKDKQVVEDTGDSETIAYEGRSSGGHHHGRSRSTAAGCNSCQKPECNKCAESCDPEPNCYRMERVNVKPCKHVRTLVTYTCPPNATMEKASCE